jgi:anti-anti-sigma regulatory factor
MKNPPRAALTKGGAIQNNGYMGEMNSLESLPDMASTEIEQTAQEPASERENKLVNDWQVVQVKSRVDSSNQTALIDEVRGLREQGVTKIALNLGSNRFLSLPVIRYIVDAARELHHEGGIVALISCPQKTRRHFEIYGSLNHIHSVRSEAELLKLRTRDI